MNIIQVRQYKSGHTDGHILIDGSTKPFCKTLEDVGRPVNIKVDGETCIPEGHYHAEVSLSQRFKKRMIMLYNADGKTVERDGIVFTGIRVHGVTKVEDTEGCVGAMYQSDGNGRAWDRASDDLCAMIDERIKNGETVTWTITS